VMGGLVKKKPITTTKPELDLTEVLFSCTTITLPLAVQFSTRPFTRHAISFGFELVLI
jgi:hypothetical protein